MRRLVVVFAFLGMAIGCEKQKPYAERTPSQAAANPENPKPAPVAEPTTRSGQDAAAPGGPSAALSLNYGTDVWVNHLVSHLMPFWLQTSATGLPYPTYRCKDGKAFGESGCDLKSGEYKILSEKNADARAKKHEGPYEWLTGPRNQLLQRKFIRMISRQVYAYGVAFHVTGKPEYLQRARDGVEWLLAHALDKDGSFTYVEGNPEKASSYQPSPEFRTSQDQSYTLMGLAFYYYLTRDSSVLRVLTRLKDDVKSDYLSPKWENGEIVRWMRKSRTEKPTCLPTIPAPDRGTVEQKELVALLDQVNAYMLLTAVSAPPAERPRWREDMHFLARAIWNRFYNDGQKGLKQGETGIAPVVPAGMFAGCLTYKGPPTPPAGKPFCTTGDDPPPFDPENCNPVNHHTDFGHSIKSFWMLYLIGREVGDHAMADFAVKGANALFPRAYLRDNGSWARALKPASGFNPSHPTFDIDRDKEWWIYAELDQMAGTMALLDPRPHVPRLNTTYEYWFDRFSKGGEVVQWLYDDCKGSDDECPNRRIPIANLWKNAFHSTEHALVAYITTAGVNRQPATLHYALLDEQPPELRPYYYQAKVVSRETGTFPYKGKTYRLVEARFEDIR